jgi:hypothetical protein
MFVLVIVVIAIAVGVMTMPCHGEARPTQWVPPKRSRMRSPSARAGDDAPRPSAGRRGASEARARAAAAAGSEAPRESAGPVPPDPGRGWIAEFEWRGSEGESRFCVSAWSAEGRVSVVAESPRLQWPPIGATSIQAMTDAVDGLERSLASAGWKPLAAGRAWYAKRFAWEPLSAPPAEDEPPRRQKASGRFQRSPAWPQGSEALWRCEIQWSPGHPKPRFEAVVHPPQRQRRRTLGGSAGFKRLLTGAPDPHSDERHAQLRELADRLEAAGWERVGRGSHWYAERFLWRRDGPPPDHVEPIASTIPPTM